MSKHDDGGPAFPVMLPHSDEGMSLRDYMAIHAPMPSDFLMKQRREIDFNRMKNDPSCTFKQKDDKHHEAQLRYEWADAMLAARAK